jgi:hypothetical protein
MIFETLQILKEQVENYFTEVGLGKILTLENIALWESTSENASKVDNKVVLTLLKLEEENTLKNLPNYQIKNDKTEYKNPPVNLNMYVLFSANCETYEKSLSSISRIIQFFQGKKIFTQANTIYNRSNVELQDIESFRFVVELHTPRFEELNHVWGTLGGRQLPSVIYKIQLVQIEKNKKLATSGVITNINGELNGIQ